MSANPKAKTKPKPTNSKTANRNSKNKSTTNNTANKNNSNKNRAATITNEKNNNSSATTNTSTPTTFSNVKSAEIFATATAITPPQLSLFDQLKNSVSLNNIKCSNNISNTFSSCNQNTNKFTTQKNLTDWRRYVADDDDSSNHSATSTESSCSSISSNSSGSSNFFINNNNKRLSASENSQKDSFQQQFVASVLGNSNSGGSILRATKLSNATISNNNKTNTSKMFDKDEDEATTSSARNENTATKDGDAAKEVAVKEVAVKEVAAREMANKETATSAATSIAQKQPEAESAFGKILDLTCAKRNIELKAPIIAVPTNAAPKKATTIAKTDLKADKPTAAKVETAQVLCKSNNDQNPDHITSNKNKTDCKNVAEHNAEDSKQAGDEKSTNNADNELDQHEHGESENADESGNNNNDNANCMSTILKTANEKEQQQKQPEKSIEFALPAQQTATNTQTAPAENKAAIDSNKANSDNNKSEKNYSTGNKDDFRVTADSVAFLRATKRAATTATTNTATTAQVSSTTNEIVSTTPSTRTTNNFTSPASMPPLCTHFFAQSKRQKQSSASSVAAAATTTTTTTTTSNNNSAAHFAAAVSLLSDQQQKQYMENLKTLLDSDKLNSVYAQHQSGNSTGASATNHLKDVVYSALTNALCGGTSAKAVATNKLLAVTNQAKKKRKKKRCTDRCDSSESSDSGVVVSLSSTDSSTGCSEDASEPGSPFSQHSLVSEDHHFNSPIKVNNSSQESQTIMPQHTAGMTSTNNKTNNGSTANGNSNNLAPIGGTHGTANDITITNTNKSNTTAKLKQIQPQLKSNTAPARNGVPTLQWPWNSPTGSNSTHSTTNAQSLQNNKKRTAVNVTTTDSNSCKKARNTPVDNVAISASVSALTNACGASAAKRLKAAALEESQTKITGYFKSQMKSQIHHSNIAKRNMESVLMAACSASSVGLNTTSLTMSAPATTASLNKYFNILAQLKESSNLNNRSSTSNNCPISKASPSPSVNSSIIAAPAAAPTSIAPAPPTSVPTSSVTGGVKSLTAPSMISMPVPALKKIERSKPPKIAQVAPNLRKTTTSSGNYATANGKSPAKKHVAIAPRTPEIKQQQMQQQQQQAAAKAEAAAAKQAASSSNLQQPQTTTQIATNQPAVLLTAIRLPTQTTSASTAPAPTQLKSVISPPKLAPVATATPTTNAASTQSGQTLYQLPAVQLPNLVQLPQLLAATNSSNIMQLNNVGKAANTTAAAAAAAATSAQAAQAAAAQYFLNGTVFKLQQFTTATTTTATSAVAAASAAATANPFNLMTAADLQEILIKQQQQLQQQQHIQLQQQQKAAAVAAAAAATAQATNTSFQEIFQQQIAAAIAANQQHQQQQQFQHLQRLGAAATQPVFMATPAGLLLNAASLPAMLAQAAAALAVNNSQQQQKQMQMQQPQQLPALQPIQSNALPALSSIFANAAQQQQHAAHDQQTDFQQQQQQFLAFLQHQQQQQQQNAQFITSTQPPPLSAVNATTATSASGVGSLTALPVNTGTTSTSPNNGNTAKLAIVKASTASTASQQFTALKSQPPPLVTISHGKPRTTPIAPAPAPSGSSNTNSATNKPAGLAKPYQKRIPKVAPAPMPVAPALSKPQLAAGKAKITAGCKIIASPTTPPPLVPALNSSGGNGNIVLSPTSRNAPKQLLLSGGPPTPALISIAPILSTNTAPTTMAATMPNLKLTSLPPLAPKLTVTPVTTTASSVTVTTTTPAPSKPVITQANTVNPTTIVTSSTPDLFDLVKNSNSSTTITAPTNSNSIISKNDNNISSSCSIASNDTFNKYTALLPSFCNSSMSSYSSATSPSHCSSNTTSSDSFCCKIKEEPMDEIAAAPSASTSDSGIKMESLNSSMHSQMLSADIKVELMEDTTKMYLLTNTATSNTITQTNEYSSYSFSSHSNSVSSAADLSLEASTPPSLSSSSASCSSAPSPAPSSVGASPRNSPTPLPPTQAYESNSASLCSQSSTVTCGTAATGRDMLSELVTSSCISPNLSSDISNSAEETVSHENRLSTVLEDLDRDINMDEEESSVKRDLPTPESGIGGSLTASESSESIVSSISSSSSKAEVIANIINSIDSNSPPPTPLSSITAASVDSVSRSSSYLRSSSTDINIININASSPISPPTSASVDLGSGSVCLSETTISSTSNSGGANALSSFDNNNSNSCTSSNSSSSGEPQSTSSSNYFTSTPTMIDIKIAESNSETTPKCAISPILSQPKTIRFPAETGGFRHGSKGAKRHDGVCYWDKCNIKHDSCSKLLDHMQTQHVNSQTGPFSCLWVGCKVYNKESCSRRWLERHVLSHGGSKQFKCIVEGCGLRFGSQLALQKHVNNHFTATENKESTNKRTSDPPVPKQLRKNGKKLRYRRQPFSARMFDFFDTGIMEGLQHRLRQISVLSDGCNAITFHGQCIMRRKTLQGTDESFVKWTPREIISDEWVPACEGPYTKTVNIKRMSPAEKSKVEDMLMTAYKLPYSPNLFDDVGDENDDASDYADEDDENNDEDETELATLVETVRSSQQQNVISITRVQAQQRRKHPRKPLKYVHTEKPLNV
ncbi:zinc finger protein jing [Eurosta solidaginis]|uniref:zinc finger protein jing n=1 Tax=Eurosta solidaginis TaxID=178769 RepID=UPI0035310F2D